MKIYVNGESRETESPNMQKLKLVNGKIKHTVRVSKNTNEFIKDIKFWKK